MHEIVFHIFSIRKIHFVILFLDRSAFTLRVHRIFASVLSTGNFLHAFPAHIDSSSSLFAFLQSTSLVARKFCVTDLQDLRILVSSRINWVAAILFCRKSGYKFLIRYAFFQIFFLRLFMLKIIQSRAESRECYSFIAGMLFSFVERSVPHCMFVRRYFACSQNSSRRFARSQTLSCKILIIVCHVSQNFCKPFVLL